MNLNELHKQKQRYLKKKKEPGFQAKLKYSMAVAQLPAGTESRVPMTSL